MISREALLAAGLLASRFESIEDTTDVEIRDAILETLTVGSLWERVGWRRPVGFPVSDGRGLAAWADPGLLGVAAERRLAAGWSQAVPPRAPETDPSYLRLHVETPREARLLRGLGTIDGRRVNAVVRSRAHQFEWQWPLRVGVAPGPSADAWVASIRHVTYHGEQFEAWMIDPAHEARWEVAIVDSNALPGPDEPLAEAIRAAGCAIIVGARDPEELLGRILAFRPNIAIAMPEDGVTWWRALFRALSHDLPIDAAAFEANPHALIAGDDTVLDATAVGHWAVLAAEQSDMPELAEEAVQLEFEHEDDGSRRLNNLVRVARDRGATPVVRLDRLARSATTNGEPFGGDRRPRPPEPGAPSNRRLITEFWRNEKRLRRVLPPEATITLEVKVAVPRRGEVAAAAPFPEPEATSPTAILEVVVTSSVWTVAQRQPISLPMEDLSLPSTPAVYKFTTGADGTVVEFDIVITYNRRPLQAATLTASVRAIAVPTERVRLIAHRVSGPPEPNQRMSPVDVRLDARQAVLENPETGSAIPLIDVRSMLDGIEELASQTLGIEDAPDTLDTVAVAMLVDLARKGHDLNVLLADLDLDDAHSIDLTVGPASRIFPLELAYAGTAPKDGARLCQVHAAHPPAPGTGCDHTSTRTVCPYAFWGMHRRVTRTVIYASGSRRERGQELPLNDVLFAATDQADAHAAPENLPTAILSLAAKSIFNASQERPVTSWTAWRRELARRKPAILVVLGHTQVAEGETSIVIGRASSLARADVSSEEVRAREAPPPIVLLMSCSSGQVADAFGSLPGTFTAYGAGAVIATLTKLTGRHGAAASREVLRCLAETGGAGGSVGDAVWAARRALLAQGKLLGLLIVSHGDLDMRMSA